MQFLIIATRSTWLFPGQLPCTKLPTNSKDMDGNYLCREWTWKEIHETEILSSSILLCYERRSKGNYSIWLQCELIKKISNYSLTNKILFHHRNVLQILTLDGKAEHSMQRLDHQCDVERTSVLKGMRNKVSQFSIYLMQLNSSHSSSSCHAVRIRNESINKCIQGKVTELVGNRLTLLIN